MCDVDDITQEALAQMFANEWRTLLRWDPKRGMSLQNYVGLVAERVAHRMLRRGSQVDRAVGSSAYRDVADPGPGPEAALAARELVALALAALRCKLTLRGCELLELLQYGEETLNCAVASCSGASALASFWLDAKPVLCSAMAWLGENFTHTGHNAESAYDAIAILMKRSGQQPLSREDIAGRWERHHDVECLAASSYLSQSVKSLGWSSAWGLPEASGSSSPDMLPGRYHYVRVFAPRW